MNDFASWVAPIATMLAAMMTAANIGTRVTGWGFVVFTIGSLSWSVVAIATGQDNLLWTNGVLTLVNAIGIWRWLFRQAAYEEGGERASAASAGATVASLFPAGSLAGAVLEGRDGEQIGTVVDAMMRCADTRLEYIVVSEGGVSGVGETLHAVQPRDVSFSHAGARSTLTRDALKATPILEADAWPARCPEA